MRILLTLITVSISALLSAQSLFGETLLSQADIDWLIDQNQLGPHLSSPTDDDKSWESYDRWQCFKVANIDLQCATYDNSIEVPGLVIEDHKHTFLFDTHLEDRLNCKQTIDTWNELLFDSIEACILAAEMPGVFDESDEISLWYIHAIKTEYGYWTRKGATTPLNE